jgi:hypothetical protein
MKTIPLILWGRRPGQPWLKLTDNTSQAEIKRREKSGWTVKTCPKDLHPDWWDGDRLFVGAYPCGLVYADKLVEVNRDYKRLGFLSYATLKLELEKDCPPELAERIKADAAVLQRQPGKPFQVSTAGQTIILGKP